MKLGLYSWETKDLSTLHALSRDDVSKALLLDKAHFQWGQDDSKVVVPEDTINMSYTAFNTWLLMLKDFGLESLSMHYAERIRSNGIYSVLGELDRIASRLLEDRWTPQVACPEWYSGLRGLGWPRLRAMYQAVWGGIPQDGEDDIVVLAIILLLVRFLLRYSPDDVIDHTSIKKFLEVNSKCKAAQTEVMENRLTGENYKLHEEYMPHRVLTTWMRQVTTDVLEHYRPATRYTISRSRAHKLPKGSVQGVCKCLFCKELAYQSIFHNTPSMFVPEDTTEPYAVWLTLVNKNWKRKRIIAPEDMYHCVLENENERIIDHWLCKSAYARFMPLHDQSVSRAMAKLGSLSGEYDTHDLSSASDSISRLLAYQVFPRRMHKLFDEFAYKVKWRTPGMKEPGDRTLYSFATSGNGCTFILEMLLFLSLAVVAARLSGYTLEQILDQSKPPLIIVYGDDIICHKSISKVLIQLLETLGFTRNKTKSFDDTRFLYRESCGGEYYKGRDVSPFYWPRNYTQPDTVLPDEYSEGGGTASLVSLVNRFAFEENESFDGNGAHQFLLASLKKLYPKLSLGGSVEGEPLIGSPTVKYQYTPIDESELSVDMFDDRTDTLICKVWVEVVAEDGGKDRAWPVYVDKDDRCDNRLEFDKMGRKRKRFISTVKVGYKLQEHSVVLTRQYYQGRITKEEFEQYLDLFKFLETRILSGKLKCNADGSWYIDRDTEQHLKGFVKGGLCDQALYFMLRAIKAEKLLKKEKAVIIAKLINTMRTPLYGMGRPDFSCHIYTPEFLLRSESEPLASFRYQASFVEVGRCGHEAIDKPQCLCHQMTPKMREAVWNMFLYEQYLYWGPEYREDTPILGSYVPDTRYLEETLGISKKRKSFAEAYSASRTLIVQKNI